MGKSLAYRYVEEIHDQLKFWPAWFPVQKIELGAIGTFRNFEFQSHTHLRDFDIALVPSAGAAADKRYGSANTFSVTAKADAGLSTDLPTVPTGKFGLGIEFSSSWSVIFAASGLTQTEIGNLDEVGSALARADGWRSEWCVVTTVISAEVLTVLVATSKDSALEVAADAPLGATIAELANVNVNLTLTRSANLAYELIAQRGQLTPLYRVDYLADYDLGSVRPKSSASPAPRPGVEALRALTPAMAAEIYGGASGTH